MEFAILLNMKGNQKQCCSLCRLAQRSLLFMKRWGLPEFPEQSSSEKMLVSKRENW